MENGTTLNVGVIGCGAVVQIEWLPYLHELDEYCVKAISDISEHLVNYFGDLYSIPNRFTDWHKVIDCPDVDAVIILNTEHTDACIYAANAGKDILVEKPLCENPEQAARIEQAVKQNDVVLMVAEMKRYDPGYLYGQKLIKEMKGLRMIRSRFVCDALMRSLNEIYTVKRRPDVPDSIRKEMKEAFEKKLQVVTGDLPARYFNFFLGAGIHDVGIMRGAFGDPKSVLYSDFWDDGKMAVVYLDYGDNVRASFEIGLNDQKWYEEELTAYGVDQTIRIIFPNPFLKNQPTVVEVIENEGSTYAEKKVYASYDEAFRAQIKHFYSCVISREEPITNVREGRRSVELMTEMFKGYAKRISDGHEK